MKNRLSVYVSGILISLAGIYVQAESVTCDRSCLSSLADQLLASIAANDPNTIPLTFDYAATENSVIPPKINGSQK